MAGKLNAAWFGKIYSVADPMNFFKTYREPGTRRRKR
jgi:hypothetical protein